MQKEQIKKRSAHEHQGFLVGPVFDQKPRNKKYILVGLLVIVISLVVIGVSVQKNNDGLMEKQQPSSMISVIVVRGDGYVKLARRAVTQYFSKYPEQASISAGQRIFVEERLRRQFSGKPTIGELKEFKENDIKAAVEQSNLLSVFQLGRWEEYAKGIKF